MSWAQAPKRAQGRFWVQQNSSMALGHTLYTAILELRAQALKWPPKPLPAWITQVMMEH